jgi:hypothetical protein
MSLEYAKYDGADYVVSSIEFIDHLDPNSELPKSAQSELEYLYLEGGISLELAAAYAHYWIQALRENPETTLLTANPLEPINFSRERIPAEPAISQARSVVSNLDQLAEVWKDMKSDYGIPRLREEGFGIVYALNHSDLFDTIIPSVLDLVTNRDPKNIDQDPRDTFMVPIGPLTTTQVLHLPDGQIFYIPDHVRDYSTPIITWPTTIKAHVEVAKNLMHQVRTNASKQIFRGLNNGYRLSLAVAGGRDNQKSLKYDKEILNSSLRLISPVKKVVVIPIALDARGLRDSLYSQRPIEIKMAIGKLHTSNGRIRQVELGQRVVDEIYNELIPAF